jgi:hypothetical protein
MKESVKEKNSGLVTTIGNSKMRADGKELGQNRLIMNERDGKLVAVIMVSIK